MTVLILKVSKDPEDLEEMSVLELTNENGRLAVQNIKQHSLFGKRVQLSSVDVLSL